MPIFKTYSQADFPAVYKWQVIAFMRCEWPFIFKGELKFMSEPDPPECDPLHFVAAEGETLLGYASILRTTVQHQNRSFTVYGFGNLFTFPPYRQEGYGSKVLQMATDTILRSDVDVAILFCGVDLEPFYARYGWQTTHSPTRIGRSDSYETVTDSLRMMLFVSPQGQQSQPSFDSEPIYVDWTW